MKTVSEHQHQLIRDLQNLVREGDEAKQELAIVAPHLEEMKAAIHAQWERADTLEAEQACKLTLRSINLLLRHFQGRQDEGLMAANQLKRKEGGRAA